MATADRNLGYEYIAICDHSWSSGFNYGLTEERIVKQREEIDRLNREPGDIVVLQGIECKIDPDGTLDLLSGVLKNFDLVITSIHSQLRMHVDEMTRRVRAALENEHVDILGHPTGRLLLKREPSELDLPAIFKAAAERHVALEINGYSSQLDLSDTNCRSAKEFSVNFSIGSDAHISSELPDIQLGIATARRGWLTTGEIINTRPLTGLREWLGK